MRRSALFWLSLAFVLRLSGARQTGGMLPPIPVHYSSLTPTIIDPPAAFPKIRCTSNSSCPLGESCYDPTTSDWLRFGSSGIFGVCLGKECDNGPKAAAAATAINSISPIPCRPNQVCAHKLGPRQPNPSGGSVAKTGRCLEKKSCTTGSCLKGWTCIPILNGSPICAPEEFTWDMMRPPSCNPATNGGHYCPQIPP